MENQTAYFSDTRAECVKCPSPAAHVGWMMLGLATVGAIVILLAMLWKTRNRVLRMAALRVRRLNVLVELLGLTPKLKILVVFFQAIQALPKVYGIRFPAYYSESLQFLDVLTLDWAGYIYPTGCLEWGYTGRLLLQGIVPLILMAFVFLIGWIWSSMKEIREQVAEQLKYQEQMAHPSKKKRRRFSADGRRYDAKGRLVVKKWYEGLYTPLPIVLLAGFALCPGVSRSIFSAWSCTGYIEESSPPGTATTSRSFLIEDPSIRCTDAWHTSNEHEAIKAIGNIFICIWPMGMPFAFLAVLLPSRRAIMQKRKTALSRATAFLHKEYDPRWFFWEPILLVYRMTLTGFVLFVPETLSFVRIIAGLMVSLGYLFLLQQVRPYKEDDLDSLAALTQLSLVCIFIGALCIKLFHAIEVEATTVVSHKVTTA